MCPRCLNTSFEFDGLDCMCNSCGFISSSYNFKTQEEWDTVLRLIIADEVVGENNAL